ncbi:MAG: fatty acid desaturase [Kiritimatiellia bacterium]|jgi:fatty acid desaturase
MSKPKLRTRIRKDLPAEIFKAKPWRLIWYPVWIAVALATVVAILWPGMPIWGQLLLSPVLGLAYANLGFLTHELLHGTMVRNSHVQDAIGTVGYLPFLISPSMWRQWHNRSHHGHTNQGKRDPDSFGPATTWTETSPKRPYLPLLPGSRTLVSYAFLFYWFTVHHQLVLWVLSRRMRGFDGTSAKRHFVAAALFWLTVIAVTGTSSVFIVLIPMAIANFVLMSHIATNHFLRPEANNPHDPVADSMSVRWPAIVDRLTFYFSHHVEHHLFPSMPMSSAPQVRAWLETHEADRYVAPSWALAIWWLYRTPRPHLNASTLVDPSDPSRQVDLHKLEFLLKNNIWRAPVPAPDAQPEVDEHAA